MKCKSEMKEELPCPNTCNPGYECKQSEAAADFVIGEVAQEGVAEDEIQEEFTDSVDTVEVAEAAVEAAQAAVEAAEAAVEAVVEAAI